MREQGAYRAWIVCTLPVFYYIEILRGMRAAHIMKMAVKAAALRYESLVFQTLYYESRRTAALSFGPKSAAIIILIKSPAR